MHTRRVLVVAAAVVPLVLAACASRLVGEVSYDDQVDFSRYRSFALMPVDSGGPTARPIAMREVQRALEAKGLRVADKGSADLLATIHLSRRKKTRASGYIDSTGEYVGMEVVLEDRASGERVWSSWAAETYRESLEVEEEIPKAVDRIFEGYPPE
jgi:hypothetical protein